MTPEREAETKEVVRIAVQHISNASIARKLIVEAGYWYSLGVPPSVVHRQVKYTRNALMFEARRHGLTLKDVGTLFDLSSQTVWMYVERHKIDCTSIYPRNPAPAARWIDRATKRAIMACLNYPKNPQHECDDDRNMQRYDRIRAAD